MDDIVPVDDFMPVTGAFGLVGTATVAHLGAPLAQEFLQRRAPHSRQPGRYANPWEAVRTRRGAPEADRRTP